MTALDRQPENTQNFLSDYSFKMLVHRMPNVQWFIQATNLPGLSIGPAAQPNPFVSIPKSGEHIQFEELKVEFKIDEKVQSFRELYKWLQGLGFPDRFGQYKELADKPVMSNEGIMSDITIMILSSDNNPIISVTYKDAFPISLTGVNFDTRQSRTQPLTATAQFQYRSYDFDDYV